MLFAYNSKSLYLCEGKKLYDNSEFEFLCNYYKIEIVEVYEHKYKLLANKKQISMIQCLCHSIRNIDNVVVYKNIND